MRKFIFLACFSLSFGVFGVLPPFEQSVSEIKALVTDHRLLDLLGDAEEILEVAKTDAGYAIRTKTHFLRVGVVYQTQVEPGPVPFEFSFYVPENVNGGG